jgi:hypothetical protein
MLITGTLASSDIAFQHLCSAIYRSATLPSFMPDGSLSACRLGPPSDDETRNKNGLYMHTGIKTTLLTLLGRILGFIGGQVDSAPNNTRFMTSPSEFTNFQIFNFQLLKFSHLLEVVVIRRKKLPGQIPTIWNFKELPRNELRFTTG